MLNWIDQRLPLRFLAFFAIVVLVGIVGIAIGGWTSKLAVGFAVIGIGCCRYQ